MDFIKLIDFLKGYNKPIYLVGIAGALFLGTKFVIPEQYSWISFTAALIFFVIGSIGILSIIWEEIKKRFSRRKVKRDMLLTLQTLNLEEQSVLNKQISKKEKTFYLNWNDFHGLSVDSDRYTQLVGIYDGLLNNFITGQIRTPEGLLKSSGGSPIGVGDDK